MVVKIKKSIKNSKNVAQFKKRQQDRFRRKNKNKSIEQNKYVDKRKLKKNQAAESTPPESDAEENLSMSSEDEIDREIAEEQANEELLKDENFDDAEFDKFQQGELDLPEDSDYSQESSDHVESDSELDEYYRELGINPDEMKPAEAKEEALYKTEKKKKKREEKSRKEETKRREKSAVLDQMIETAKKSPNTKTLSRIIQIVKQVFGEGKAPEP